MTTAKAGVERLIALGASNLTRGLDVVVSSARATWGPEVEVLAALGHGRSYGARSRVLARSLPGILDSGLWRELESRPARRTRAIVTDVGNDILYGFSVEQTLAWVGETVSRLLQHTRDIALASLPVASVQKLSPARFLFFRTILVPSSRLALGEVRARSEALARGISELATRRGLRHLALRPSWYGFDPIHIRRSSQPSAWREILGVGEQADGHFPLSRKVRLYTMRPERQWLFGLEQQTPQHGVCLPEGGRIWLY